MLITTLRTMEIDDDRWGDYRARIATLPESYRTLVEAIEQYLLAFGRAEGDQAARMFEDLADLFEECAALSAPAPAIVGDEPAAFVEEFLSNYRGDALLRAQQQLRQALVDATRMTASSSLGSERRRSGSPAALAGVTVSRA